MSDELQKWEYRVQTIGGAFGTRDELIEETLNEWGEQGWKAFAVYTPSGSGSILVRARRVSIQPAKPIGL